MSWKRTGFVLEEIRNHRNIRIKLEVNVVRHVACIYSCRWLESQHFNIKERKKKKLPTNLSIEHVRVKFTVTRINPTRIWLKQTERKCFRSRVTLVSEKRVRVNSKRSFIILQKLQHLLHCVFQIRVKRPGRWRIRLSQHSHRMNGGNFDFATEWSWVKGILDILYRRKKVWYESIIAGGHNFVTDGDESDVARRVIW